MSSRTTISSLSGLPSPSRDPQRRRPLAALVFGLAALAAVAAFAVPHALADGESAETSKTSRVELANRQVEDLHELREILLKNTAVAKSTHQKLLQVIRKARVFTQPITAADLTDAERTSLALELAQQSKDKKQTAYLNRMRDRLLEQAVDGAGLSAEEEAAARRVVGEWYTESAGARVKGDSKKVSDLVRDRDAQLRKALGRKKAKKVISNLNRLSGWGRAR